MKNLFVPYELALKLKNCGFNEECLAFHYSFEDEKRFLISTVLNTNSSWTNDSYFSAPLYQQIIDWFRAKGIRIYESYPMEMWAVSQKMKEDEFTHWGWKFTLDDAIEEALKLI